MKIACAQIDVQFGKVAANRERIAELLRETAGQGAEIVIFPECALPGYCFDSLDEARPHAETIPGPSTEALVPLLRELAQHAVIGMLESVGDRLFNACVLLGPDGVVGHYRKVHLPFLGIDRFTTPGDLGFRVWQVGDVRVGMNICYDGSFPEAARVMTLEGADLIVLPTNWPPGAECTAEHVIPARAMENNVYYAAVNRVGTERGFRFIGQSKICDPSGKVLAEAPPEGEAVLYAEIDPSKARQKRILHVPGKHEIDRLADRRPEMYGKIVE